ncbi:uncharacterized protein LOC144655630 [Oculina patagonica]
MASASGTSLEQRRWLVVGIALQNVLTPCLRDKVKNEMTPFYQHMVRNFGIDKQTYAAHQKTMPPSALKLNYGSINNNAASHPSPRHYDYCVKDEVSLAKLFMKPFMAHFNAFDSSFDASAALAVLCGAPPFTSAKPFAEDVRSNVRNTWAHCDFAAWTEAFYDNCFDLMEALVANLRFTPADETRILGELRLWKTQGLDMCLGKPLDDALLDIIRKQVQGLSDALDDYKENEDTKVRATIELFKSEFDKGVVLLQEKQSCLERRCQELQHSHEVMKEEVSAKDEEQKELLRETELQLQMKQEQVESFCKTLEVKTSKMQNDLEQLKTAIDIVSTSEDHKQIVFDAPEQNKWFTGRENEMKILERCLTFESDGELKMAAICGLGGSGKTTLAANFAWKRKFEYEGGVFWFSMEDDRKFENTVNDLALRLEIRANSFDLTLSDVLTWISKQTKPWLLVLDDVDQLNLSDQMQKVLSGRWKRQAKGHLLLTTRREKREISQYLDLELSCCVDVFSFTEDEAKMFLATRCSVDCITGQEEVLNELVNELGCLPLALEQAGAHIKALQCPIFAYLEEYRSQRIKLLSQHPAKPSWEYKSQSRLAVHTTWLLNFEYVKKSAHGELASRFVQAAAFLAPDEIQEELINHQLLSVEDPSDQSSWLPLMKHHIVEILAKFSLFQRKTSRSLGLHRLVQEVIRNRMTIEETASSLLKAIRLLHLAFQGCPSPDQVLTDVAWNVQEQASASVADPSMFHLWSKLTSHASELQQHVMSFLDQQHIAREVKKIVLTRETSRVIYENAVQLSVHGHQEEAKEAERFALQVLDACTSDSMALPLGKLEKLFPHTLPLSQMLQKTILYSSQPQNETKFGANENCETADIDAIRLQGNSFFKDGHFNEAVETYTKAIEASKGTGNLDPRLLNNRATAYLKLGKFEQCFQDSERYINIMPNCWKGYSRKALALNGLGIMLPALCSAAIAYYYEANCCRGYEAFRNVFQDLDGNWEVVESSEALQQSLIRNKSQRLRKKALLIRNGQYEIPDVERCKDIITGETLYTLKGSNAIVDTTLTALSTEPDVTITCDAIFFFKKCFFQSITLSAKETIFVERDGKVQFHKCSFLNAASDMPVISIKGAATFLECTVKDSDGSGIVVAGSDSSAVLVKSHISGNGKTDPYAFGIRVFNKGSLMVRKCHIYGNTRGIWIDEGPVQDVSAKGAIITGSEIYDNKYDGVAVGGVPGSMSPTVIIRKCKIFHNGTFGIRATLNINDVLIEENMIFENYWWGVCVHNNSGGHYRRNEICNNKMGGIIVSNQSPGKPPCVVENNFIHDNCGPAFYEGLRSSERNSFPPELHVYFKSLGPMICDPYDRLEANMAFPNMVSAVFKSNECLRNDHGQQNIETATLKAYCGFCLRRNIALKSCKSCMTARYCGRKCQKLHWGKHKYICKASGKKNAIEVSVPVTGYSTVWKAYPGLEPSGPDYASPPPRDGSRFVVKVQTIEDSGPFRDIIDMRGLVTNDQDPNKATMRIYDRSHHVYFDFSFKPQIYHLVMEFGMMGVSMSFTKKLYCWAAFKDGKTLRIFTHEFPPVQKW